MKRIIATALVALTLVVVGQIPTYAITSKLVTFSADVWADNWFTMYVNGVRVATDPVPITTTKSFNKVTVVFKASYPLSVAIIAKDYSENKSGLEYIGTPQQQIGDAGLIAQIHEQSSGLLVGVTTKDWKVLPIFQAPLNADCVNSSDPVSDCKSKTTSAPGGWYSSKFVDKSWRNASTYTESQVGVKEGFLEVKWEPMAHLIWSSSLTVDNTVLFRGFFKAPNSSSKAMTLNAPKLGSSGMLQSENTCDGQGISTVLSWSNVPAGTKSLAIIMDTLPGPARPGEPLQTDFSHLVIYNLSPSATGLDPYVSIGTLGKNFKGSLGYTPPCSQGPGLKEYTYNLYAVSDVISQAGLSGTELLSQIRGKIISNVKLTVYYSRKA